MENEKFDREAIMGKMRQLQTLRHMAIFDYNVRNEHGENGKQNLMDFKGVKYLGKIELTIEGKEELLDLYMTIEEIDGKIQYKYYDENMQCIGMQREADPNIILSNEFSNKTEKEQADALKQLYGKDKESAITLDELENEDRLDNESLQPESSREDELENATNAPKQQQTKEVEQKNDANQTNSVEPKNDNSTTRLTEEEVNKLKGPRTSLATIIEGVTLGNIIGVSGEYIKFVDATAVKEKFPEFKISASQKYVPIAISSNGTAIPIGEDKLSFSHIEGANSMQENTTMTNGGQVNKEQSIETFNIGKSGKIYTLSLGYDEDGIRANEIHFGVRDITDPEKRVNVELPTEVDYPRDNDTHQYQRKNNEGIYRPDEVNEKLDGHENCKADVEVEEVDPNRQVDQNRKVPLIHPEDVEVDPEAVEEYARKMMILEIDPNGNPKRDPNGNLVFDLEGAEALLRKELSRNPDQSVKDIIEGNVHQIGPAESPRPH